VQATVHISAQYLAKPVMHNTAVNSQSSITVAPVSSPPAGPRPCDQDRNLERDQWRIVLRFQSMQAALFFAIPFHVSNLKPDTLCFG